MSGECNVCGEMGCVEDNHLLVSQQLWIKHVREAYIDIEESEVGNHYEVDSDGWEKLSRAINTPILHWNVLSSMQESLRNHQARINELESREYENNALLRDQEIVIKDLQQKLYIAREKYEKKIQELQSKIDSLMLEYCPEDMTAKQIKEWGDKQAPSKIGE